MVHCAIHFDNERTANCAAALNNHNVKVSVAVASDATTGTIGASNQIVEKSYGGTSVTVSYLPTA